MNRLMLRRRQLMTLPLGGGSSGPTPSKGALSAWYDAENSGEAVGTMTGWEDAFGNGNDIISVTGTPVLANNVLNGFKGVTFNESSYFHIPNDVGSLIANSGNTFFIVVEREADASNHGILTSSQDTSNQWGFIDLNPLAGYTNSGLTSLPYGYSRDMRQEWQVLGVRNAADGAEIWMNGMLIRKVAVDYRGGTNTTNHIGNVSRSGFSPLRGKITEVIIYDALLSDAEMSTTFRHFASKYNLFDGTGFPDIPTILAEYGGFYFDANDIVVGDGVEVLTWGDYTALTGTAPFFVADYKTRGLPAVLFNGVDEWMRNANHPMPLGQKRNSIVLAMENTQFPPNARVYPMANGGTIGNYGEFNFNLQRFSTSITDTDTAFDYGGTAEADTIIPGTYEMVVKMGINMKEQFGFGGMTQQYQFLNDGFLGSGINEQRTVNPLNLVSGPATLGAKDNAGSGASFWGGHIFGGWVCGSEIPWQVAVKMMYEIARVHEAAYLTDPQI